MPFWPSFQPFYLALQANAQSPSTKQRRTHSSAKPSSASSPPLSDSPDPTALKWAAKNPWFGTDLEMTYFAYEVHDQLIEEEGITADMPEYYTLISARVEAQFPERFFLPGLTGMDRQASVVLAGGQVSTAQGSPMYRQGSNLGSGIYRQGSSIAPALYGQTALTGPPMYRQGSSIGSAMSRQGSSVGPSMYRQGSAILPQLSSNSSHGTRLYRGSSTVAALTRQQQQDQLGAVRARSARPVVPALPLSQQPTGDDSPRLQGPRSDRGVGSLFDRRTGTPKVDANAQRATAAAAPTNDMIPLSTRLSNQLVADMSWAVGQRAEMA